MKYILLFYLLLFILFSQDESNDNLIIPQLKEEIDKFYKYQRLSSISFSLFIKDSTEWHYQRGFSDINAKIEADEETLYPLASVTKPITASLLLKYVSDQKLQLSDSAYKYLSFLPEDITISELLTHSSGFKKLKNFGNYKEINNLENLEKVIPSRGSLKRKNRYRYHNINYAIISAIVEQVSKNKFSDEMKSYYQTVVNNESLSFLHLKDEYSDKKTKLYLRKGYRRYVHNAEQNALWQGAALAMTSSKDLLHFLKFHMTDKFISLIAEHKTLVKKRTLKNNDEYEVYYGAGYRLTYVNKKLKYIYHNGFIYGGLASMYYFVDQKIGFVALSNMTPYPKLTYSFGSRFFSLIKNNFKDLENDEAESDDESQEKLSKR
jgi:CubicO group peptidase (beta-lactamase class C family)